MNLQIETKIEENNYNEKSIRILLSLEENNKFDVYIISLYPLKLLFNIIDIISDLIINEDFISICEHKKLIYYTLLIEEYLFLKGEKKWKK